MGMEDPEKASPKRPIVINLCSMIITCVIFLIIVVIAVVFCTGGNHKATGTLFGISIGIPAFWLQVVE